MSQIDLHFFRHWEHEQIEDMDPRDFPLTEKGIQEIKDTFKSIPLSKNTLGLYTNNTRSALSMALAMMPNTEPEHIQREFDNLILNKRITKLDNLNYKSVNNPEFRKQLDITFQQGNLFEFLVNDSEKYVGELRGIISSYDVIVRELIFLLKRYQKIMRNIEGKSLNLDRLICTRVYIYWCLRVALIWHLLGKDAKTQFVKQFTSYVSEADASKMMGTMNFIGDKITLKDSFGELNFSTHVLNEILEAEDKNRVAAYCIPVCDGMIWIIQTNDWYNFIGWWLQKWESIDHWLTREISEEVTSGIVDINKAVRIKEPFLFNKLDDKEQVIETRTFYYHILPVINKDIHLTDDKLTWVPISELSNPSLFQLESLKIYANNILRPSLDAFNWSE